MSGLLAALRFLTIFPIPGRRGMGEADLAGCVPWFPIVGLILGGLGAALALGLSAIAPPLLSGALLTICFVAMSAGLHMDGLSDTADGFLSSRGRERTLEIMKDSRVGAMGVLAIVSILMIKWAALATVPARELWRVALVTPLAGRAVMVLHMALLPYARSSGLSTIFYSRRHRLDAVWAFAVLLVTCGVTLGLCGIIVAGVCGIVALALAWLCLQKIGGATGDTFGALCEITETVPAVVVAIWGQVG